MKQAYFQEYWLILDILDYTELVNDESFIFSWIFTGPLFKLNMSLFSNHLLNLLIKFLQSNYNIIDQWQYLH